MHTLKKTSTGSLSVKKNRKTTLLNKSFMNFKEIEVVEF